MNASGRRRPASSDSSLNPVPRLPFRARYASDDDNVVTEGDIRAYQTGEVARGFGFNVDDVDATYLVAYRAVILWPFNAAGEMLGEDGYSTLDPDRASPVAPEDLPAAYLAQFAG